MIKIAHIADLHIGSNQYGIEGRRLNQRLSILKLAEEIKSYDICLVAGDIFDSPTPTPEDISLWNEFGKIVSSDESKVIACVGNHDKVYGSEKQWIDLSPFMFQREKYSSDEVPINSMVVYGLRITYVDHVKRRDLPKTIDSLPDSDIIMMHQSCSGFMSSIMRPEIDEELMSNLSKKARYIALGDLHIHKIMNLSKSCTIAYPGNVDFLRLCDPHTNFKYLSISVDNNEIKKIDSIPFEPTQKTKVLAFDKSLNLSSIFKKDPESFYVIRYFSEDQEKLSTDLKAITEDNQNICFYLYREKPKQKASETNETVNEDTDFMGLVKKESYLEDRDVDIINDIWNNPNNDNVESILRKDLESQVNANNQSTT